MKSALLITFALWALAPFVLSAEESAGTWSVDNTILAQGGIPTLQWHISHPATSIEDIVTSGEDGDDTITAKIKLRVQVFVIVVGITDGRNEYKPTSNRHIFSGGRKYIFEGNERQVNTWFPNRGPCTIYRTNNFDGLLISNFCNYPSNI